MVILLHKTKLCVCLLVMLCETKLYFIQPLIVYYLEIVIGTKRVVVCIAFFFFFFFFYSLPLKLYHDKYLSWMNDGSEYSK